MASANLSEPITLGRVEQLAVKVYSNRKEMGRAAGLESAERLRTLLASQSRVTVIFAAAPSQNEFLETLAAAQGIEWDRVTAMHMDEYVGLAPDAPQRFGTYLKEHIFERVNPGQVYYLDGNAPDLEAECERYSHVLRDNPVDVVCAGIGENGHLAFNDPGVADFLDTALVKVVALDQTCRQQQVNDGCFRAISEVPTHALTLTVPALMGGRWIYCMVPGPTKAEAIRLTLSSAITDRVPATILRVHPRAVLYADRDSAARRGS
jgi:glucosamine-6-phosphate deaminase